MCVQGHVRTVLPPSRKRLAACRAPWGWEPRHVDPPEGVGRGGRGGWGDFKRDYICLIHFKIDETHKSTGCFA